MILTPEQQALLDGAKGETMAKVVKTLVMYGDAFGAERMVPVTSKYGHTVISFGLKAIKPVYALYDQLLDAGLVSGQKFTADPKPLDPNVPSSLLEDLVFKKIMYTDQKPYEEQLIVDDNPPAAIGHDFWRKTACGNNGRSPVKLFAHAVNQAVDHCRITKHQSRAHAVCRVGANGLFGRIQADAL